MKKSFLYWDEREAEALASLQASSLEEWESAVAVEEEKPAVISAPEASLAPADGFVRGFGGLDEYEEPVLDKNEDLDPDFDLSQASYEEENEEVEDEDDEEYVLGGREKPAVGGPSRRKKRGRKKTAERPTTSTHRVAAAPQPTALKQVSTQAGDLMKVNYQGQVIDMTRQQYGNNSKGNISFKGNNNRRNSDISSCYNNSNNSSCNSSNNRHITSISSNSKLNSKHTLNSKLNSKHTLNSKLNSKLNSTLNSKLNISSNNNSSSNVMPRCTALKLANLRPLLPPNPDLARDRP